MAGEEAHETGREGVRRAKDWLERTGRVDIFWTAYEQPKMLAVKLPGGGARSFDMGGIIRGGDLEGSLLYAEVKKYSSAKNLPGMYEDYLATCYCHLLEASDKDYEYMWITWHPFSLSKWVRLCDWEEVRDAVEQRSAAWLGPGEQVDEELCQLVASRLWLIVLSDRQELLGMSDEMLGEIDRVARLGTKR